MSSPMINVRLSFSISGDSRCWCWDRPVRCLVAGLWCMLSGSQVERGHVNVTQDRKGTRTGLLMYLLVVIKILIDLVGHTYIYLQVSDKEIWQCWLILHFGIIIQPAPPLTQSVLLVVHKKASKELIQKNVCAEDKDYFDVILGYFLHCNFGLMV